MLNTEINGLLARIFIVALTMVAMGLVMVSSSSMALSDHGYGSMSYHTYAHLARVCLGVFLAYIISNVGIKVLRLLSPSLMLAGLILSALVFVPGLSVDVNGASRWLRVGPLVFQPYDLFKLGFILFFSYALDRYFVKNNYDGLRMSVAVLVTVSFMLLSQPDFGSLSLLVSVVLLLVILVTGVTKNLIYGGLLLAASFVWLIVSEPYRMKRMATFFDPWSDRYGSGFQLIQAMVAEGSGGITGIGLGESIQKMLYLPEAHTDFLFSVLSEELGFVGCLFVIILYVAMVAKIFFIGIRAEKAGLKFGAYLSYGISICLGLQAFLNIGVNMGALPTKGLTLPFISYGGNSILSLSFAVGLVLRVYREYQMGDAVDSKIKAGKRSKNNARRKA